VAPTAEPGSRDPVLTCVGTQGKQYIDFLSAYSAVNQGHSHPKIVGALIDQAQKLTLSSRAFYNDVFPVFAKFVTEVGTLPIKRLSAPPS
jgi:acetylornithine/succinyldiaminopimelate/putrescine aminotransferase